MATGNPLVSLIMPCYQQERFVRAALRSALSQDYSPLEIIVADDASSDGTYDIVREESAAYRGPHRVSHGRSPSNRGIGIYNVLVKQAQGEFIVVAHGDDVATPDRVSRLAAKWRDSGASLVASNALVVDAEDRPHGLLFDPNARPECSLEQLVERVHCREVLGATLGCAREVFERFAPLDRLKSPIRTDVVLPFRAALLNGSAFVTDPLLRYRFHRSPSTQLADRSSADDLPARERSRAERVLQLLYLLETLEDAPDAVVEPHRRRALRERLLETLARESGRWALARNQLVADGWRVSWNAGG